jgi:hypothetical protein
MPPGAPGLRFEFAACSTGVEAKQSFAELRSQAELETEGIMRALALES